mmetsp:Transcript_50092/g.119186  ORF Transcript_50092/g.119186 Transcript_50092/m.119186 type:complete len:89 (-) Transcript_50092:1823-2089(-)
MQMKAMTRVLLAVAVVKTNKAHQQAAQRLVLPLQEQLLQVVRIKLAGEIANTFPATLMSPQSGAHLMGSQALDGRPNGAPWQTSQRKA